MPSQRSRSYGSDPNNPPDDSQSRSSSNQDQLRSQLLDAAHLTPKVGRTIYAEDVKVIGYDGEEIRFMFPRSAGLTASAKEVDFVLEVRGIKVEEKFKLSDMQYQGQLAL